METWWTYTCRTLFFFVVERLKWRHKTWSESRNFRRKSFNTQHPSEKCLLFALATEINRLCNGTFHFQQAFFVRHLKLQKWICKFDGNLCRCRLLCHWMLWHNNSTLQKRLHHRCAVTNLKFYCAFLGFLIFSLWHFPQVLPHKFESFFTKKTLYNIVILSVKQILVSENVIV